MKKLSINEMKELCPMWFSKGAMDFFNSQIETQPNKVNIFITSERMELDMDKLYTLRWFNHNTNKIETLGDFQEFKTLEDARQFRKTYTSIKEIEEIGENMGIN
ncbi:hypothetical protein CPT_Stahl107 [Bacillus phage Stahl]|uniref:Uncharacterized protein n=1 Tax=Bacillus phage Stahl TaxID=1610832 RepID=A0A0E3M1F2_9CAUD|nr:hypothetical protein CPT_Stahl107 [Bacillus phage Stahl]AKA61535.1 hypothetical protein CPT_Stahl107 [Bacillus phage Stahl]